MESSSAGPAAVPRQHTLAVARYLQKTAGSPLQVEGITSSHVAAILAPTLSLSGKAIEMRRSSSGEVAFEAVGFVPRQVGRRQRGWLLIFLLSVAYVSIITGAVAESLVAPPARVTPGVIFATDGSVRLPSNYRRWQHVGTRVKTSGNSVLDGSKIGVPQVMNAFVEPNAFDEFRRTGQWPEGTQIVKEFSTLKTGTDCNPASFICSTPFGFGLFESSYDGLGMMVKDSTRFPAETGHWGYFSFETKGTGRFPAVSPLRSRGQCSACHEALAASSDYVFSSTHIGLLPGNFF